MLNTGAMAPGQALGSWHCLSYSDKTDWYWDWVQFAGDALGQREAIIQGKGFIRGHTDSCASSAEPCPAQSAIEGGAEPTPAITDTPL